MSRAERVFWIAIFPVIALVSLFMIWMIEPSHGAVIECNISPGHSGVRWMWREIDGRRCWFVAPPKRKPDQPKEQLRWRVK